MSYALVTGAAKGIGRAIAEELAIRNFNLVLVDIDADQLYASAKQIEKQHGVEVLPLVTDLSAAGATEQVLNITRPYHHELTVVVNNASYSLKGAFQTISLTEQLNVVDVNIKTVLKLSNAYIPVLKKFKNAFLLNVASIPAYQTVAYLNVYASTKAFILSFTRGLQQELKDSPISISCLSTGNTNIDFARRAGMGERTKKLTGWYNMHPQTVAKISVTKLFAGVPEIVPGFANKLTAFPPKFFPKWLVEKISGNIYKSTNRWIDPAMGHVLSHT